MDVFSELIVGSRAYLRDAAAAAAHELELFAALPCPAVKLAERLRVRPRRLAALVRVLLLDGVLLEADGVLRLRAVPVRQPLPREGWGSLAEVIRTDRPLADAGVAGTPGEDLRRFHDHLWSAGAEVAAEVAIRLGPHGPLLDLGGGAGAYAAAFLAAHPGETATIVDRPAVLELARERVPGASRLPADLLAGPDWPRANVALFANVLHLYGARDASLLIARAARALLPGGTIAVKDFDAKAEAGILFSLNMALYTENGEVHDSADVRAWLEANDAGQVRVERLRSAPDSLLVLGTVPR